MTRYVTTELRHKCDRCHIKCTWREMILSVLSNQPDGIEGKGQCPNCGLTMFVQLEHDKSNTGSNMGWVKTYYSRGL